MELNRYAAVLLKWWWLLALATGLAALFSLMNSSKALPLYRATTTVLVGQFLSSENPQPQDFAISQQLAQYYAQQVRRQSVLQATITSLGLNRSWVGLSGQVNAVAPNGTQLIIISVVDPVPTDARMIADEIALQLIRHSPTPLASDEDAQRQFVSGQLSSLQARITDAQKEIGDLEGQLARENSARRIQDIQAQIIVLQDKVTAWQGLYSSLMGSLKGSRTNYLSILEPAAVPTSPISSSNLDLLMAMAMAFVLAAGAAFLLEYLDDRVRTKEDVLRILGMPALGEVPTARERGAEGTLAHPLVEAYRLLRTSVQLALGQDGSRLLLVVGATGQEDASTTAANLAESFARAGRKTILVDADLHHPSLHTTYGVSNDAGLATLLQERMGQRSGGRGDTVDRGEQAEGTGLRHQLEALLQATRVQGLRLLPSGVEVDSSRDGIDSGRMVRILGELKGLAEVVIVVSAPVLAGADAAVLAANGMGVLLVVEAGRTRGKAARMARDLLPSSAAVLGVVLSRAAKGSRPWRMAFPGRSRTERITSATRRATRAMLGVSRVKEKAIPGGELPS